MKPAAAHLRGHHHGDGKSCNSSGGFTLVELLLVIGAISILLVAVMSGFDNSNRFFAKENVKASTQQSTRFGMDIMIQDLLLAGLNPLGAAGSGILAAGPTSVQVAFDLNFDGDFSDPFETVTYALNGTRVEQTNHLGTETLVENVSNFGFTYFDRDGAVLPDPPNIPDIRSVGISMALTRPAGRGVDISRNYSTRIRCRNL